MCGIEGGARGMEVTRVPLSERIEMAQDGRTAQPEYLPSLIRQWGKMSIRAYFAGCTAELERFCELMKLTVEDNPTYDTCTSDVHL